MSTNFKTCWVVTDGKAGMESQCLGLARVILIPAPSLQLQSTLGGDQRRIEFAGAAQLLDPPDQLA